jgi:NAD(P) transhydrogenase subunit alpha
MIVGVPRETFPGERRVALVPAAISALTKAGLDILVERGAGDAAGFPDEEYRDAGASIASQRAEVFESSGVIFQVRTVGANPKAGVSDLELFRPGQTLAGFAEPLTALDEIKKLAERSVTAFAMELIPRISRAQSMDALTAMATISGYKAALLAGDKFARMFPMMMTATGTISPARVLVVGTGVAGLQAIATSRRLGAVVQAYDIRPAAKIEVESLGAKFLELEDVAAEAEGAGGYARAQSEETYRRQQDLLSNAVAESHIVITTAAVPGKKAPVLISEDTVARMAPGSIIVDLAAERGGNCAATVAGETAEVNGVSVYGPVNLASEVPYTASQLYAKSISNFFLHLFKDGEILVDPEDPIGRDTLVTRDGQIVNTRVLEAIENLASAE